MRKGQLPTLLVLAIIFTSCKFQCQVGKDAEKENLTNSTDKQTTKNGNAQLLNNIILSANDVQVNRAFLASENGDLISSDNKITLGEKVVLTIMSQGWKNEGGKSFIGISQVISTNTGATVLDTGDMFAKYDETGINAEFTNLLKLTAYITETKPEIEYFKVDFRVWDKKGDGEITGSYKFYVK